MLPWLSESSIMYFFTQQYPSVCQNIKALEDLYELAANCFVQPIKKMEERKRKITWE